MPILEMHLKADDELFKYIEINNKDDFILGSLFPDVMWLESKIDNDSDWHFYRDKLIAELHHAVMIKGNLRLPNYFEFISKYNYVLGVSDFMKGVLFHLILDYENNKIWNTKVTMNNDTYIIHGNYGYNISCSNVTELVKYKYSDMKRFINNHPCNIVLPKIATKQAITECNSVYKLKEDTLPNMIKEIGIFYNSKKVCSGNLNPIFFEKHYVGIINNAIDEFSNIYTLYNWKNISNQN